MPQNDKIQIFPAIAAVVALVGLGDAIYLIAKYYSGSGLQCTIVEGCEEVLRSEYSQIAGIPLSIVGAAAYFTVFSLATLAAFGNRRAWQLFALVIGSMAIFTVWLTYLQAFVIKAFCQYCLLSAAVTFTMLTIVALEWFFRRKPLV